MYEKYCEYPNRGELIHIQSPTFVAGIVLWEKVGQIYGITRRWHRTAEILRFMRHWQPSRIARFCRKQHWRCYTFEEFKVKDSSGKVRTMKVRQGGQLNLF